MKILYRIFIVCLVRPIALLTGLIGALLYVAWCEIYKYRGAENRILYGLISRDIDALRKRVYNMFGIVS